MIKKLTDKDIELASPSVALRKMAFSNSKWPRYRCGFGKPSSTQIATKCFETVPITCQDELKAARLCQWRLGLQEDGTCDDFQSVRAVLAAVNQIDEASALSVLHLLAFICLMSLIDVCSEWKQLVMVCSCGFHVCFRKIGLLVDLFQTSTDCSLQYHFTSPYTVHHQRHTKRALEVGVVRI